MFHVKYLTYNNIYIKQVLEFVTSILCPIKIRNVTLHVPVPEDDFVNKSKHLVFCQIFIIAESTPLIEIK
jgi:hypothetical protein